MQSKGFTITRMWVFFFPHCLDLSLQQKLLRIVYPQIPMTIAHSRISVHFIFKSQSQGSISCCQVILQLYTWPLSTCPTWLEPGQCTDAETNLQYLLLTWHDPCHKNQAHDLAKRWRYTWQAGRGGAGGSPRGFLVSLRCRQSRQRRLRPLRKALFDRL